MTTEEMKKMESIDTKIVLGDKITKEEKDFYNKNWDEMVTGVSEKADHWKYHTAII